MAENKNAKTPADDDQPVAWRSTSPDGKLSNKFVGTSKEVNWTPIYTEPPKQWVGLTDKEIDECYFAARQPDFDVWESPQK